MALLAAAREINKEEQEVVKRRISQQLGATVACQRSSRRDRGRYPERSARSLGSECRHIFFKPNSVFVSN